MDDRLESGFGGWADEKIQTAREAPPLLGRKKSYPQHLTISPRDNLRKKVSFVTDRIETLVLFHDLLPYEYMKD
jgi:hypothetical protein